MNKENLQFAVSSISCSEHRLLHFPSILIPQLATKATVERIARFRDALEPVFGRNNISASFHLGYATNATEAVQRLRQRGIKISSIDTPDIFSNWQLLNVLIKSLKTKDFKEVALDIGWRVNNVGSFSEWNNKIDEGLKVIETNPLPKIVRSHAGAFLESQEGEELRKKLNQQRGVILAIEIEARKQTPAEYIEFLKKLAKTNDREAPVFADIDLGHLGESKYIHGESAEIPEPLQIFENFLKDRTISQLIAITTLNQYKPGDVHTHTNLMVGQIDLIEVARKIGKATKNNILPFSPMVLAEFYPFEYEALTSEEGKIFFKKMRAAYEEEASI